MSLDLPSQKSFASEGCILPDYLPNPEIKKPRKWLLSLDYRSLALFRFVFGLVLLFNLWMRTHHGRLLAFYSEEGVLPLSLIRRGTRWSFLDSFSSPESAGIAFVLIALVYAAYTVGLFTKLAKWLVVICLLSLYHRNPLVDDGSDWVMRLIAVWTAFLPLGTRLSIDSLMRGHHWIARESRASVASVGLCLNLSLSYFLNSLQKNGSAWHTGDAVRLTLWDPWVITPFAATLRTLPGSYLQVLSFFSLILEFALGLFILLGCFSIVARRLTVVGMFLLHGGFALCMYLGTFSWLYLAVALIFIPGTDWDRQNLVSFQTPSDHDFSNGLSRWMNELVASLFGLWCLSQLLVQNPIVPQQIADAVRRATPTFVNRISMFTVITQEWFMFSAPSRNVSTALIRASMSDGSLVDPIRGIPFDIAVPVMGKGYMGKYWVSYLFRLSGTGYDAYRARFSEYLFSKGVNQFALELLDVTIPEMQKSAGSTELPPLKEHIIFSAIQPAVLNVTPERVRASAGVSFGQQDMHIYGTGWVGFEQLLASFDHVGQTLFVRLDKANKCIRRIYLDVTRAPDFGRFSIGTLRSSLISTDLSSSLGVIRERLALGDVVFDEGEDELIFTYLGTGKGGGSKLGLDTMTIECDQEPSP